MDKDQPPSNPPINSLVACSQALASTWLPGFLRYPYSPDIMAMDMFGSWLHQLWHICLSLGIIGEHYVCIWLNMNMNHQPVMIIIGMYCKQL